MPPLPQHLQAPQQTGKLIAWVTSGRQNVEMGRLVTPFYFYRAHVHVTEAFNSDGTDNIEVGYDADNNAFVTSVDVSSTGVKSVTLGTLEGFNGTTRNVEIYYTSGGSEPTTGKALVILEFTKCPVEPS